ncbi:U11/U12 small nuclear ribonucleoprotein 25 kDa protein-like isoform X1 [Selaginella moellendorffii]|uniref:U11/U12 small nuclear ribonucleoprotein 25 kDa protein-like isoform X1 n=1 Tax=Selaginella moellendorffii TaxID=88036 RepID=UPI000D1C7827|nr:U11/U12 small nuclear ribonucleoprotein 25 kDa protein-like isoform X1 [Selaginella moellendorffii]|eukprot:XP_024533305.1 U11/U12 small nuclear ribonucleoprotein 25 kDa protein-like isoform X1 [Selaginella moellendorffii]
MKIRLSLGGSSKRFTYQAISSSSRIEDDEPLLTLRSSAPQPGGRIQGEKEQDGGGIRPGMIKLLVLKLDGTSFDVSVPVAATVGEMKSTLERTVNELEVKVLGYCDIQWEQVWSNFCLCYMNQKLLDDKASLRAFGIHDDDQVAFLRHSADPQEPQTTKRRSSLRKSKFT